MDPRALVRQAALENARWCDLVCAAHGAPGELRATHWLDRHPVPPFYPRLVTLGGPELAADHLAAVRALLAGALGEALAVKDSFHALELAPLGLDRSFEAEWIALDGGAAQAAPADPMELRVASDAAALARWEAAWRGAVAAGPEGPAFPPALLRRAEVEFVWGERGGEILATCVLHRSDGVVGLSNLGGDPALALQLGVATARERHPDLPLVGYESGEALRRARSAGFVRLGPLAVWGRPASRG